MQPSAEPDLEGFSFCNESTVQAADSDGSNVAAGAEAADCFMILFRTEFTVQMQAADADHFSFPIHGECCFTKRCGMLT
jgi:hypothetical protein